MTGDIGDLMPTLIAVPIVVACVFVAVGKRLPHLALDILAIGCALAVTGMAGVVLYQSAHGRVVRWIGGWQPAHGLSVGIPLVADELSAGLAVLIGGLVTCALLFAQHYYAAVRGYFHALMLLFLAGMEGFCLSGDLFNMFVFFELMGAVAYALTSIKIEDATSVQGGLNFGIVNSLGAYLSLTGVGLLYSRFGQLGLPQLGGLVAGRRPDALVTVAFVLVVIGFLVKAAAVPFHFWLADAHAVAPAPVCVLFSGAMVELGVYGTARVYWVVFGGSIPHADVRRAMLVLGVLTAVVGAVMCFAQRHLKRLLAYSTIAHLGLFLLAFATLDPDGTAGAAEYVVGHAGVKAALFLLVGIMLAKYGTVDELDLRGRGRDSRFCAVCYFAAGLGLAGLPPFGTGLGKAVAEDALATAGYPWAPVLFVLVSATTGAAVLRAGLRIYFGLGPKPEDGDSPEPEADAPTSGSVERRETEPIERAPATMMAAVVLLLAGALAGGLAPGGGKAFGRAAALFVDAKGYVTQALAATPQHALPAPHTGWTGSGIALDVLSCGLAVAVAFFAIWAPDVPGAVRTVLRPCGAAIVVLRRVHSGHVGDYVAWLMLGLVGLIALIGVPLL